MEIEWVFCSLLDWGGQGAISLSDGVTGIIDKAQCTWSEDKKAILIDQFVTITVMTVASYVAANTITIIIPSIYIIYSITGYPRLFQLFLKPVQLYAVE